MVVKTVIFDIGDVLVTGGHRDWFKVERKYEEQEREMWKQVRVGDCSIDEYWKGALKGTEHEGREQEIAQQVMREFGQIHQGPAYHLAHHVHAAGYRTAIISNHTTPWAMTALDATRITHLFEPRLTIISDAVKLAKPDPKIYRHTLELLATTPEECLFIDDQENNIASAKAIGLHTILCKERTQVEREADSYLRL